jgi:hypothetical protein
MFERTKKDYCPTRASKPCWPHEPYKIAPAKTNATPSQCSVKNRLLKYHTLNIKLKNFLRVRRSVTVTALVLLIKRYTPAIQNHLTVVKEKSLEGFSRKEPKSRKGRRRREVEVAVERKER